MCGERHLDHYIFLHHSDDTHVDPMTIRDKKNDEYEVSEGSAFAAPEEDMEIDVNGRIRIQS